MPGFIVRLTTAIVVAGALVPAVAGPAAGQEVKTAADAPITVRVRPARTLSGGVVSLGGSAIPLGDDASVSLTVQPPGGLPPVQLGAPIAPDGTFHVSFAATQAPGVYPVLALAPGGKAKAVDTLRVVPAGEIPAATVAAVDGLLDAASAASRAVREALAALPASPELAEAAQMLEEAEARSLEAEAALPAVQSEMTKVFTARAAVAEDNPAWDAYVAELEDWEAGAGSRRDRLEASSAGLTAGTELCADLDRIVEALTFVSEATNYANVPIDRSAGYWVDKIPGGFAARSEAFEGYNPATKFLAVSVMKTAANFLVEGPAGVITVIPGLIGDALQLVAQQNFADACEKFEGPISATFIGESFTKQGEPYLSYTILLDGKLVLMHAKGLAGDGPLGLTGYVEGSGSFDVRDNPAPIVRLTPGQVLFHKVIAPPGSRYWDEVGQFSRALLPHSFRIPVHGTLSGDSLAIELGPAAHDFGETIKGRSIYVVMPLGGLWPEIIDSPFSLQKAHPIIERVVRRHPVMKVARGPRQIVAEGTFARDTTNADGTARVRTTLTMRACSPGCLPLPLTPGKAERNR